MKKLFSLIFVAMLATSAWADITVTFIPGETTGNYTSASYYDVMTLDGVTITCTSGAFAVDPYRFAAGSTASVLSTAGNIKKVEFYCQGSYSESYGPDQFYGENYTTQSGSNVGTWQGYTTGFQLKTASQVRCTKIVVTLSEEIEETHEVVLIARKDKGDGDWLRHHFTVKKDDVTMYVGDGLINTGGHYAIYGPNDSSAFNFTAAGAPILKIEFSGLYGYGAKHMTLAEGIDGALLTPAGSSDGTWLGRANFIDFDINMQVRLDTIIVTVAGPRPFLRGDVDRSGTVNISDATDYISYLLGADIDIDLQAADCNYDNEPNITDVIQLINYLLNDIWYDEEE